MFPNLWEKVHFVADCLARGCFGMGVGLLVVPCKRLARLRCLSRSQAPSKFGFVMDPQRIPDFPNWKSSSFRLPIESEYFFTLHAVKLS